MKLSISNIAWESDRMDEHLRIIKENGADGLEIAPSLIWKEPADITDNDIYRFRSIVDNYELELSSMHSLTYTRPDLKLFDTKESRDNFVDYIIKLSKVASKLKIPVMVFGSPQSRNINELNKKEYEDIFIETFKKIAGKIREFNVKILLEPLSRDYTNFINSSEEAVRLVHLISEPEIKLHVDLRTSFEIGEDIEQIFDKYIDLIYHCHVSNPGFKPPDDSCLLLHKSASSAINKSIYNRYISIEVGRNHGDSRIVVSRSLNFVNRVYFKN